MSGSSGQLLQQFLIGIGYQETGRKEFTAGLEDATKKAAVLGVVLNKVADAAIKAAGEIAASVTRIIGQLDALYFVSIRSEASVLAIKSIAFAMSNLGSSAAGAVSALEGLGHFLRTNPAGEGFIQTLGIKTRETNGQLRDMGKVFGDLGAKFRAMPVWQALSYGSILGISEREVLAMIANTGELGRAYDDMAKKAGIDFDKAAKSAHLFTVETRTLWAAFDILGIKITSVLSKQMTEQVRLFRVWLVNNFETISRAIVWMSARLLEAGDILTTIATRTGHAIRDMAGWFMGLDQSSKTAIEAMVALAVAFWAFNFVLSASPIAKIAMAGLAIAGLADDYQKWKASGGRDSLIDWTAWEPAVTAAIKGVTSFGKPLVELFHAVADDLVPALVGMFKTMGTDLPTTLSDGIDRLAEAVRNLIAGVSDLVQMFAALAAGDYIKAAKFAAKVTVAAGGGADANIATGEEYGSGNVLNRGMRWVGDLWGRNETRTDGTVYSRFADRLMGNGPRGGASIDKRAQAQEAYQFWTGKGFTPAGAASMVAQEQHESGFDPRARGDGGQGQGLFQHHADRRAAIFNATGIDMSNASAQQQREGMYQEMRLGLDAQSGAAFAAIKNATVVQTAVEAGVDQVERPLDRAGNKAARGATAAQWLPLLRGGAPSAPTPADMERARGLPPGTLSKLESAGQIGTGSVPNTLRGLDTAQPLGAVSNDNSTTHAPTLNQTTTITVNGGTGDLAREIADSQRTVNQNMIRNMGGSAR